MAFDSRQLLARLQALTGDEAPSRWLVAYSGGVDSTVLLHALVRSATTVPVAAIHIDHGVQPQSAAWQEHCRQFAQSLGVVYESRRIECHDAGRDGPEASLRRLRYAALQEVVRRGDCLLSAHHQDDQAETLLLNALRGSGAAGLAGIGGCQPFGRGRLLRPLLDVTRADIEDYRERHRLPCIEDPSNADTRFDRNFLRHEILPLLARRWPAVRASLGHSAALLGEASELLGELADIDLARCGRPDRLALDALQELSPARQRNLLRRAVRLCGLPPVPSNRLLQVVNELIPARADAQPLVAWTGAEIRRYRQHVYLMAAGDARPAAPAELLTAGGEPLSLGPGLGMLALQQAGGRGIDPQLAAAGLQVRFRQGGEEIRIAHQGRTRKLKKLLQDEAILPWMRARLPLLFAGTKLVAVADLWLAADCAADNGFSVRWHARPSVR